MFVSWLCPSRRSWLLLSSSLLLLLCNLWLLCWHCLLRFICALRSRTITRTCDDLFLLNFRMSRHKPRSCCLLCSTRSIRITCVYRLRRYLLAHVIRCRHIVLRDTLLCLSLEWAGLHCRHIAAIRLTRHIRRGSRGTCSDSGCMSWLPGLGRRLSVHSTWPNEGGELVLRVVEPTWQVAWGVLSGGR